MKALSRRSVLVGSAAASIAAFGWATSTKAHSTAMDATDGKDTIFAPGVVMRVYSEGPAIIPGFKSVRLLDIIMQPGSKTTTDPMPNPMVCHMLEGELRIVQDGKESIKKKNEVWTCNTGTHEQDFNDTNAVAVMRITFLLPAATV